MNIKTLITQTSIIDVHMKNGKRPKFDEYVGRRVPNTEFEKDSIWANLFDNFITYESYVKENLVDRLESLIGKKIGCWCITTNEIWPTVCHAQIILKLIYEYFAPNLIYKKILMITGSRNIKDVKFIFNCLTETYKVFKFDAIIEGEAEGVDEISKLWAKIRNIPVLERLAKWKIHGKRAGLIRNLEMIEICSKGIAVWDGNSKGTLHSITNLKKQSKLLKIFYYK